MRVVGFTMLVALFVALFVVAVRLLESVKAAVLIFFGAAVLIGWVALASYLLAR